MSQLSELNKEIFEEIKNKAGFYIIDFWAVWCGPCKVMTPIFEKLAEDKDINEVTFYGLNVDEESEVAEVFGVSAIPTFFLIKTKGDGTFNLETDVVDKFVGTQTAFDFKLGIQAALKKAKA
ncbi:MAG: thioredoxin family protein [bacterium]